MSNVNNPFGFRPVVRLGGYPFSSTQYGKPATDAQAIFMFDVVHKVVGSVADPTGLGPNMPTVQSAYASFTPGTTLTQGVSLNYGAASTATPQYVMDDPDLIFIAQVDGALSVTTASHVGKNANIGTGTAGSATTKQSGMTIANGSIAATAGLDMRLLKICGISPNAEGANAIVEILFLKHQFAEGSAGN